MIEQPQNKTVRVPNGRADLKFNPGFASKYTHLYSRAQKYVDLEILRSSDKYTPFRTGILIKSGQLGTKIGSGTVEWIAPYARYLYYGKVMAGKPKKPTAKNLRYVDGPTRGAFWFERMWQVWGKKIIAGVKKIVKEESEKP